ncbi:ABC transporter ATP-binding protein [Catellatospora sp. NPDC049609]|uniref:ABC transporter ATP-binding protein n=1 Tax=Catellatospora sp. NPDC049609 TaxID=3155505 RepID=UPI00343DA54F
MIATLKGCLFLLGVSWRQSPRRLAIATALMLLQATALPLLGLVLAELTDRVLAGEQRGLIPLSGAAAVLALAALTAGHFAHVAYFELGELNVLAMERDLIDVSNGSVGLAHHEDNRHADRLQVLRDEVQRAGWTSIDALLQGVSLAVGVALTAVLLGKLDPWLLLLPVAAVPPIVLGRRAELLLTRARLEGADLTRRAHYLVRLATQAVSAKELRISGLSGEVRRRHSALWEAGTAVSWRAERRSALLRIAGQAVFGLAYPAAILVVVTSPGHSVGSVILAITLCSQVNQQVTAAVLLIQELHRFSQVRTGFTEIREATASSRATEAQPAPDHVASGIRLRGLSFAYAGAGRRTLDDIDVFLPAGAVVAIVGENGAGKSTIVKLLTRFYEPTAGAIEIDGVDLRRIDVQSWRERIAAGFQDFVRFEFTAQHVVGIGDLPRADSAAAVGHALHRAGAGPLVDRLPRGLATPLGRSITGAVELSGGQWQKLALARAMMRPDPVLLVLDEPTSALDPRAEHALFEQYADNSRRISAQTGAVTLIVSHRFSTVQMADLILVVDNGKIIEAGSHDQLMARPGLYAELYLLQAQQYR